MSATYIPEGVRMLIREYYGRCGLESRVYRLLEELPKRLARDVGRSEDDWRRELSDPRSQLHTLNLIRGAVEWAVEMAKSRSERTSRELCWYLETSIERDWIGSWLAGYVKSMRS